MSLDALFAVALAIIGDGVTMSQSECALARTIQPCHDDGIVRQAVAGIQAGSDPLGNAFCQLRSQTDRRGRGQTFTPDAITDAMIRRARLDQDDRGAFARIVDPGAGSGRFLLRAAAAFPQARLVGVELDPACALILRANVAALGLAGRTTILVEDFCGIDLPPAEGRTLFIGNPPYVRHHELSTDSKQRYADACRRLGVVRASKLAGLHLHFFVQSALLARPGDAGLFVTSSEWLQTGYGSALRSLLLGRLGGVSVHALDAACEPFPGTMTTAAVTMFRPGIPPARIAFGLVEGVDQLGSLTSGHELDAATLAQASKWPGKAHDDAPHRGAGDRIGDLFKVSRGQVTGMNDVWLVDPALSDLPQSCLRPCVTAARELFATEETGYRLDNPAGFRCLVVLPEDLRKIEEGGRVAVEAFLGNARRQGAHLSYVARQRRCWWAIPVPSPAPIVCTYMARRAPVFARNLAGLTLVNIAHGLRPRQPMSPGQLDAACAAMNAAASLQNGRTYAGGLTKFEPGDVEAMEVDWQTAFH